VFEVCVAVCCSVLQCFALCCEFDDLPITCGCCSVLQCVLQCVLQHVAACCSVLYGVVRLTSCRSRQGVAVS